METNLLKRLKDGDDKAFEELYERYGEYALRVATAITKNHATAADVVQETFIRIYHYIDNFDINKPFEPWFYRILVNECNRSFKKHHENLPISDYMENSSMFAKEDEHDFVEYQHLYEAIGNLKDIYRIPIILKYLKGFKEAEIAEILGINHNTIKSRLLKGRRYLKSALNNYKERSLGNE